MLDAQVYIKRNQQIQNHCLALMEHLNIQCFHTYLAIEKNKEPETQTIIQASWVFGRKVLISKIDFNKRSMSYHTYESTDKIQVSNYGIPEPFNKNFTSINGYKQFLYPYWLWIRKGIEWGMERDFMMNY